VSDGPIKKVLSTEMDRKEFLRYSGAVILGLVGVSALTKSLKSAIIPKSQKKGYGKSPYGR
jgi:predicted tellurium resistance membrane protein TerC